MVKLETIVKRKNLRNREDILDNMRSIELSDNLFRIVQIEDKLKRNRVDNEYIANSVHYEIGKKVIEKENNKEILNK